MNLALILSILGLIITGGAQGIIIPLLTLEYNSLYFILFIINLELCIILLFILLIMTKPNIFSKRNNYDFLLPNNISFLRSIRKKDIATLSISGLFSSLMGTTKIYASPPERTPPVMQSILAGLAILPSVILTKYVLKKSVIYNRLLIIISIIFLLISILIPIIDMPFQSKWELSSLFWMGIYTLGVVFRSVFNILQEKYFMDTDNASKYNKIVAITYTNIFQLLFICSFVWIDIYWGYNDHGFEDFSHSMLKMVSDLYAGFLLQGFIFAYFLYLAFSIYVNSISTNYNMIVTIATTPIVALFFTIFSNLNSGIQFSWAIVIVSLICSIISIITWMCGEHKIEDGYEELQ